VPVGSLFYKHLLCFLSFITNLYRLKDDDLAGRVGLQVKELNKLMATLEKDGLIQA
jgi:transcription initiation factor IIE alpha subunit